MAEAVLESLDQETGAVIPPNLVPGKFVTFSADNIDIMDESLDGKNSFHATQVCNNVILMLLMYNVFYNSKERTTEYPKY